eukprot:TRINITY_DN20815_c0_g1_i1.p1 TRINITY_DN20815_c0_g1~~TRINITY_DN20815_c0_g1_i1.p1  ORF type:complete len:586 (+),score=57.85 TRINITY_DN20815_c0_g1_i1:50-1807(+)
MAGAVVDTNFFTAIATGDVKEVQTALYGGARINARDRQNNTPLILACECNHTKVVEFLLRYDKPRVLANPKDNYGETALMKACRNGNARIVTMLLATLTDLKLDARNANNESAFDLANGNPEILTLLEKARDHPQELERDRISAGPMPARRANSGSRPKGYPTSKPRMAQCSPTDEAVTPARPSRPLVPSYAQPIFPSNPRHNTELDRVASEPVLPPPTRRIPQAAPVPVLPPTHVRAKKMPREAPHPGAQVDSEDVMRGLVARCKSSPFLKGVDEKIWMQILNEVLDRQLGERWNDICGLGPAKQILYESVILPEWAPEFFTGLRSPPRGVLLFGPPGNGKTMLARALAAERKSSFFNISASSLVSKWLGEGEKLVRALFSCARALAPSIIFLDECDSVLTSRSSGEHEGTRRLKNEFLAQTDGIASSAASDVRVLLVGATNRPQDLDEAVIRRFSKRVFVPLPDGPARRQIAENLLAREHCALTLQDWEVLMRETEGYSASDLKTLLAEMVMIPVREVLSGMAVAGGGRPPELTANLQMVRPVTLADFRKTKVMVRPSVQPDLLRALLAWDSAFGSALVTTQP